MPLKTGAINEIFPFAPEGLESAGDLMTLAEYAAHVMRKRGHMPGLALRDLQNRANRQSAHMAAGLAQFIANLYTPGVVDDGDLDKIEEGLRQAIVSFLPVPLTDDVDFYVSPGGNDKNDGTASDAAHAWKTPAYAIKWIQENIKMNGRNIDVHVYDGTYNDTEIVLMMPESCLYMPTGVGLSGLYAPPQNTIRILGESKKVLLNGKNNTPTLTAIRSSLRVENATLVSNAPSTTYVSRAAHAAYGAYLDLKDVDLTLNSTSDSIEWCRGLEVYQAMASFTGVSTIRGYGGRTLFASTYSGRLSVGTGTAADNITLTGQTFDTALIVVNNASSCDFLPSAGNISGEAIGKRYLVTFGILNTNARGDKLIPGTIDGTVVFNGVYS